VKGRRRSKGPTRRPEPSANGAPLDRWGTLNALVANDLAGLTTESGPAAAVVWFALFALADGRTGWVTRAGSRRLAALTGLSRNTVKAALRGLTRQKFIQPDREGRPGTYLVKHHPKPDGGHG
jgi:hypothetical protein